MMRNRAIKIIDRIPLKKFGFIIIVFDDLRIWFNVYPFSNIG
jgi:hypothetical protein